MSNRASIEARTALQLRRAPRSNCGALRAPIEARLTTGVCHVRACQTETRDIETRESVVSRGSLSARATAVDLAKRRHGNGDQDDVERELLLALYRMGVLGYPRLER